MTAQGSPITVLRRAVKARSMGGVDIALVDVPQLDLQDALEIVVLMHETGDPRYAKWAERWAERAAFEQRRQFVRLLEQLPDDRALAELRAQAEQLRKTMPAVRMIVRPS